MSPESAAALIGMAVYLAMRLVDRLLPPGYHLTWLARWLTKDNPNPDPEEAENNEHP